MPISGRYDLPLATFNLPSRNSSQSNRKRIPPIVIPESPPPGGASHRSCGCAVAKRLHGKGGAGEDPGEFFHTLSGVRAPAAN